MIALLTGTIGIGKTTVCLQLAQLIRDRGLKCGGVLSPALIDARSRKMGIRLVRLDTGEGRVLALTDSDLDGPRTGRYSFSADVLAWGVCVVREALAGGLDLVFIDEIGPLELLRGEGLAPLLEDLRALGDQNVLVVVREGLLGTLRHQLGDPDVRVFRVSADTRNGMADELLAWSLSNQNGSPGARWA